MATDVNFGTQQYFGFDPRTLPSCSLWLDATDARTLTLSGSSVTGWADKSVSGATFTTVSANPTYTASLINGLPGVDLTNASGFVSSTTQSFTTSLTLAMVLVVKSGIGAWGSFFTHGNRDLDIAFERNSISTGTTLHFQTNNDNATGDLTFTTDQVALYIGTMTSGTSRFFARFGGGSTTTTTATNALSASAGLKTIRIGRSDIGEVCNSLIGEVVYYNRDLPTAERQQLEGYLAWKWGISSSLPVGHPYKQVRPLMRMFQPVDISGGALLWLDAADTRTITGSPVTQWTDKSGRGSNATSTGALGSVVTGTAINSWNTLRFGFNNTLNLSNFVMPSAQTSIFYVFRGVTSQPTGGTGYFIFSRTADNFAVFSGNQQFASYQNVPAGRGYVLVMGPGGERNWGNLSTTAFTNAVNVIATTGISYASSNGLSLPLVGSGSVSNTVFTGTTYQISTSRSCCSDVFTYDLGELVVYDGTSSTATAQRLEGYLADKWGVRGSLPSTHPFRTFPPATALFVPTALTGCVLWLDASDPSVFTGGATWTDKSGTTNTATNGTPGTTAMPTTTTWSNGLTAARFVIASRNSMKTTNAIPAFSVTYFVVCRYTALASPAANQRIFINNTDGQRQVTSVATTFPAAIQYTTNSTSYPTFITVGQNEGFLFCLTIPATTAGTSFVYANGSISSSASQTPLFSPATANSINYFGSANGASDYLSGDIAEVLVYSSVLTLSQRQVVEGYLAWKWGLQNSLPTNHPYSKFRP